MISIWFDCGMFHVGSHEIDTVACATLKEATDWADLIAKKVVYWDDGIWKMFDICVTP